MKWYILNKKQFDINVILTGVVSFIYGLIISYFYGMNAIFTEFYATVLFLVGFIIILIQISPYFVTKYVHVNEDDTNKGD